METSETVRPRSAQRLRRKVAGLLTILTAMGGVRGAQAADACEQIGPPPPISVTECSRIMVEFGAKPPVLPLATAKESILWTDLQHLGVAGKPSILSGNPKVWVLPIRPDVFASVEGTTKICNYLQQRQPGGLTSFEPSQYVSLRGDNPTDPMYSDQVHILEEIHAVAAWDRIAKLHVRAVPVAVVDSGVHFTHPDLEKSMWASKPHGQSFLRDSNPDDTDDTFGHGTTVSGILAATTDNGIGIASIPWHDHVQVVIARFARGKGGCVDDVIAAIHYAAYDADARVINLSLGTSHNSRQFLKVLQDVGHDKNHTLFVAAVGNSKGDLDNPKHPIYDYPTSFHLPNVISVQASGCCHDFQPSAYGKSSVHIAAPDVGLETTDITETGYSAGQGTSVSAPQVSATAALISEFAPQWTYSQVKQYLIDSARDPACEQKPSASIPYNSLCGRSQSNGELNVDAATGAPLQFTWPAEESPWRRGTSHEVSWNTLFATDLCREVEFSYSTDDGWHWTLVPSVATARVSALHQEITLPDSIPPGTTTRLSARCTDTTALERWSRPFVVE
jgi:hypothetical protein